MRLELAKVDCDDDLLWVAHEMYHAVRKWADKKVAYSQPHLGQRSVMELGIRIQRWTEMILAGGRCGLDEEAHSLARVPFELHLNQILLAHGKFQRSAVIDFRGQKLDPEAEGFLSSEELGDVFHNHAQFERLGYVGHVTVEGLEAVGTDRERRIEELEGELAGRILLSKSYRSDWHGMSSKKVHALACEVHPSFLDEFKFGEMMAKWPDIVPLLNKGLHASALPNSKLYAQGRIEHDADSVLLVDHRKEAGMAVQEAGFVGIWSVLMTADAMGGLSVAQALARQHIAILEREAMASE